MNKIKFLIFLLSVVTLSSTATVRHINVRDGLSSRQVYEIAEDRDGFIWICTNSGLDRYDGYSMKYYHVDTQDVQSDHIQQATTMETASDGTIRIAVKSGSIYRYNRQFDRFDNVYKFADASIQIYNFAIEGSDSLVICTGHGLYRFVEGHEIEQIALSDKLVRAVVPDGSGGYYAGTDEGLYHVEKGADAYSAKFVRGTEGVYVLTLQMSADRLFVGSFADGVYTLDRDGRIGQLAFKIPELPVNSMKPYDESSVLIGVDGGGAYLVDSRTGRLLHHYCDVDGDEDGLSGNTVTDVHIDRNKGIWISTSHNGLNYIPPFSHTVNVFRGKPGNVNSLISDYVNIVYEDRDGDLWFGTDKGVSRYSRAENRWWRYISYADHVAGVILSFGEDCRGRILVGTYGNGLNIIDKATGSVAQLPVLTHRSAVGVGTDYVFAGYGLPDGSVWIGGINGPLTRYNVNDDSYRYYHEDCIAVIVNDIGGPLFGGNKGVGRYSPTADSFTWTQTFGDVKLQYPVRTLLADTLRNELWIGTQGDGIVRYNRTTGQTHLFTTADGLSSNSIYSLVQDKTGCVWACTEADLYRIDPVDNSLKSFTGFLGINRGVFNAGGGLATRDGDILFGTAEGCVMFNPAEQLSSELVGDIQLTDFRIHGQSVQPEASTSPLSQNINLTERVKLRHNQNTFEVGFALINYASPRRIGYEYMLDGYDTQFASAPVDARARYSELPPGSYTLIVRAIDLYSGKPIAERRLVVDVSPHVLLSAWAIVLYIILLCGLLYFVFSALRRVRRERRIESQLQSYAAIAHDIRTPMSMIKAPLLNVELEGGLSDSARANLQQARSGIDKTMGMLDEMLGLRREMHGVKKLQVQLVDILKYLQVKVEEYSSIAIFKGIAIECVVAPDMPKVMIDVEKFDHIIDNLMSNAIKYTNEGKVTITVCRSGRKQWTLSVTDTGIGMTRADARYVFKRRHRSHEAAGCDESGTGLGLLITDRLVRDHRGSITFTSEQGRGSTFTLTLPLAFPARFHADSVVNPNSKADTQAEGECGETQADSRSTIYVVDDDLDMCAYLKAQLSDDYNVVTTDNATVALEEIHASNPDLVILDVMMPRLRGDEMCRMLKTNIDTSHIPVILLTGLAGREDVVAGLEANADDYIVKPFDIVVVKARIRNILKSRRELGRRVLSEDCKPAQEEFTNELDRRFMTRTMEIIDEHIADSEFSVNEFCSELGMSRTSVYNKIKSLSGQSPNEFMRIMRLNRAKELLSTHTYNISEVAYMVGFSDPKYFSTCFKKQFGFSPSKI